MEDDTIILAAVVFAAVFVLYQLWSAESGVIQGVAGTVSSLANSAGHSLDSFSQ